jgi:hypothetical protein
MNNRYDDPAPKQTSGRRQRSRRRGPLLPTVWFCVVGVNWWVLTALGLIYALPHPLKVGDFCIGALGGLVGCFYFWVAYAVYHRRRYIIDVAFACAGLGILSVPVGTLFSILLLSSLMSRRHDFTK